jgi:Mycobacterium membrane protein
MKRWGILVTACILLAGCSSSGAGGPVITNPTPTLACDQTCQSLEAEALAPDDPATDDLATDDPILDDPSEDVIPDGPTTVTYRITSNGHRVGQISYLVDGGIEQRTNAKVPWSKNIAVDNGIEGYVINAQASDGTSVTCEIVDDLGDVLSKHTSKGAYAFVQCEAQGEGDS